MTRHSKPYLNDGDTHPYYTLPESIQRNYRSPSLFSGKDTRPGVIRITYPNDRRIEVKSNEKTDVYVWDKQWLQIG